MACYQWRTRAVMATLIAVSVSACVPMQRQRAAYTDLCQSEYPFKVPGPQGETTLTLETYLYDHAISYAPSRYTQALFSIPYVNGPEAKPEFYVQLIAYNKNRQRPSRPGKKGEPAIPVLYDSRQAYVTLEDGTRVNARPELFLGMLTYDFPIPDMKYARQSPYDINSDEVHRRIPKLTNNDDYGSVYVIFKTPRFTENAKWIIHLGEMTVAGQKVAIPPMPLCYHPQKEWIGIEPLMRP
ncbi:MULTISPECIES: hypothetical protein [unclassified Symbiopectobacterium]|uniref:hypothetical protein n=1 Tax=unclassified Symbiopectobacterium TaxID=2794573 RepID=UPI002226F2A0|nr:MULTISPECIES: hypothetical protein [unclassified Symbiopectobacterium]